MKICHPILGLNNFLWYYIFNFCLFLKHLVILLLVSYRMMKFTIHITTELFAICRNIQGCIKTYPIPHGGSCKGTFLHNFITELSIGCTLKEEQPLRLPLNLIFYCFNRSEPTYKSQSIKLLKIFATCNQLNISTV